MIKIAMTVFFISDEFKKKKNRTKQFSSAHKMQVKRQSLYCIALPCQWYRVGRSCWIKNLLLFILRFLSFLFGTFITYFVPFCALIGAFSWHFRSFICVFVYFLFHMKIISSSFFIRMNSKQASSSSFIANASPILWLRYV